MDTSFEFSPQNPPPVINAINIIKGDAYDGTGHPELTWIASDDSVDAETCILTLRDTNDNSTDPPVLQVSTTGLNEFIRFSLSSDLTNSIPVIGRQTTYNYDVEVQFGVGSFRTIARGTISVSLGETRR